MAGIGLKSNTALVLFSHGSLLCGSGQALDIHAQRLREGGGYVAVEPGYLNYCKPTIEDAVGRCLDAGAATIIVVPYFLVAGKFVTEDLPRRLASIVGKFPAVEFVMARAIEDSPVMADAIDQVILSAQDPKQWRDAAVEKARRLCELRRDCPIYGSNLCRAESAISF